MTFSCPPDMKYWCDLVFSGEYDVPGLELPHPVILDLGANCGAFSLWASQRWPGSLIHAYEPSHTAYSFLIENTKDVPTVTLHKCGVVADDKTKLYFGAQNLGQATFCRDVSPTYDEYELPQVMHPAKLPACDIMKLDTEGCEREIISEYLAAKHTPTYITFEYHRDADRMFLDELLNEKYILVGSKADKAHRGVVKYLRRQT